MHHFFSGRFVFLNKIRVCFEFNFFLYLCLQLQLHKWQDFAFFFFFFLFFWSSVIGCKTLACERFCGFYTKICVYFYFYFICFFCVCVGCIDGKILQLKLTATTKLISWILPPWIPLRKIQSSGAPKPGSAILRCRIGSVGVVTDSVLHDILGYGVLLSFELKKIFLPPKVVQTQQPIISVKKSRKHGKYYKGRTDMQYSPVLFVFFFIFFVYVWWFAHIFAFFLQTINYGTFSNCTQKRRHCVNSCL